jgi:hypothetical protein
MLNRVIALPIIYLQYFEETNTAEL